MIITILDCLYLFSTIPYNFILFHSEFDLIGIAACLNACKVLIIKI
jgi:hypothetical protein